MLRDSRRPDRRRHRRPLVGPGQRPAKTPWPPPAIVDAQTWIEEPAVRDAFVELLGIRHLLGGEAEERLPALFAESVLAAEEITEALGVQVRRAVELVVAAFSESAADARERGDPDPLPDDGDEIYEAVVTVMMRVVFLLFAEERGLLPQGQLFAVGYGLTGQLDALERARRDEGEEALDGTHLTWHRLLATSQALYRGATFEDMRLPAYGGSLFDPDRFAFLTATTTAARWRSPVSDRVMLRCSRPSRSPRSRVRTPAGSRSATSTSSRSATSTRACSATPAATSTRSSSASSASDGDEPEIPLRHARRPRETQHGPTPRLADGDHRVGQGRPARQRSHRPGGR